MARRKPQHGYVRDSRGKIVDYIPSPYHGNVTNKWWAEIANQPDRQVLARHYRDSE